MQLRLVLLGAGNALGQALVSQGAEVDISFSLPRPPQQQWTEADLDELMQQVKPDAVINLAYYFDWFQAGRVEPENFASQQAMVTSLAMLCKKHQSILIQPSSYRVFDGYKATAYDELSDCNPLSPRGQALLHMEQSVREYCKRHIILRFGWLLDDSLDGVLGRVMQRAQAGEAMEMADDRRGNPTPVADAARIMIAILKQLDCTVPLWGTYQYGGQEASTTQAVAEAIVQEAREWRSNLQLEIIAKPHAHFEDAKIEPQHGVLDCKKITHTFGIKPRSWRAGLAGLLDGYYRNLDSL